MATIGEHRVAASFLMAEACNITCPNCKKEKEHLYVEDDSKIISLVTLDDDNCKPIKKYDMAFINFGEEISNELGIAIK